MVRTNSCSFFLQTDYYSFAAADIEVVAVVLIVVAPCDGGAGAPRVMLRQFRSLRGLL